MKVRNNSASVNVLRRFGMNQTEMQKDLEKLSSGFKINKAGDDAAGLAVSESMRDRIRGLEQGHNNIDDGISLINTAEGGLEEITAMLQRMGKLAHQALNDTYTEENRQEIQAEINELKNEIVRIADNTEFNDIKVLSLKKETSWKSYNTTLPDWLINDDYSDTSTEMAVGNITGSQDPTNVDQILIKLSDTKYDPDDPLNGKLLYEYYGPEGTIAKDDEYITYKYIRPWTESLNDNLSACIDFGGLVNKYDGSDSSLTGIDLYKDVYSLLGTSMGVSCATCENPSVTDKHYYGFSFYGKAMELDSGAIRNYVLDGMTYTDDEGNSTHSVTGNSIDISKIMIPDESGEPLFDFLYSVIDGSSEMSLKDAAVNVAKALQSKTYEGLKIQVENENHYDDVLDLSDASQNIFKVGIYDYRDVDTVNASSVEIQTKSKGYYREEPGPLWIQCSSSKLDRIPLEMPYIDLVSLGIDSFDVSEYRTYERDIYNIEDVERERAERADESKYTVETITTPERHIHNETPARDVPIYKTLNDENGEGKLIQVGSKHVPKQIIDYTIPAGTYTTKTYNGFVAYPTGREKIREYVRPNVDVIDKAINKISSYRAALGAKYNRLEHTKSNNEVMDENVTASESRIRDTNMAVAMGKFQKDSLLLSATETMLGVANDSTRGILDLLG